MTLAGALSSNSLNILLLSVLSCLDRLLDIGRVTKGLNILLRDSLEVSVPAVRYHGRHKFQIATCWESSVGESLYLARKSASSLSTSFQKSLWGCVTCLHCHGASKAKTLTSNLQTYWEQRISVLEMRSACTSPGWRVSCEQWHGWCPGRRYRLWWAQQCSMAYVGPQFNLRRVWLTWESVSNVSRSGWYAV